MVELINLNGLVTFCGHRNNGPMSPFRRDGLVSFALRRILDVRNRMLTHVWSCAFVYTCIYILYVYIYIYIYIYVYIYIYMYIYMYMYIFKSQCNAMH